MQEQKLSPHLPKEKRVAKSALVSANPSDLDIASLFLDTIPHAMQSIRVEMRNKRSTELTLPQFRVLANLWAEPANNRMLADTLGLSVAATSRMIDWLIKHGLAEKTKDGADRRQIIVQLTPLGKKTFELNKKQTRLGFEKKMKTLSVQAKQNLAQGLLALQHAIAVMADQSEH